MSGCIHIYCGDGKGKSTAAMGLTIRAAGSGMQVLLTQFLKTGESSEMKILREIPNVHLLFCKDKIKGFVWNMSEEQKCCTREMYRELFEEVCERALQLQVDLLVLDEFNSAYNYGFVDQEKALNFLKNKPEHMEVVLTGRDPAPELLELADYVSEIKKIKHPFDAGLPARVGIEK